MPILRLCPKQYAVLVADVNWVSPEGDTPLLSACRNGHASAALCLLSHGAEVNLAAADGQTALHLSCRQGMEMIAEALIHRGANVSVRDGGGEQPCGYTLIGYYVEYDSTVVVFAEFLELHTVACIQLLLSKAGVAEIRAS